MKKLKKPTTWVLGIVALTMFVWVGGHAVFSWKAESTLSRILSAQFGSDVKIKSIRSNYFGTFYVDTNLGTITVNGRVNPLKKGLPWNIDAEAHDIQLESLEPLINKKSGPHQNLKGSIDLRAEASGRLGGGKPVEGWKAEISGKRMKWIRADAPPVPFAADLQISEDRVDILSAVVRSQIHIKGQVKAPWSDPELNLIVRAEKASVPKLIELVSSERQNELYGGTVSFLAQIKGPVSNPSIKGNGSAEVSYAKLKMPPAEGEFSFENRQVTATANLATGRVDMKGQFTPNQPSQWSMNLIHISLTDIAQQNGWQNVKGDLNARLNVATTRNIPEVKGNLRIDGFRWGRYKTEEPMVGYVNINNRNINIFADPFVLKASIKDSIASIEEFRLPFGKTARLSASGRVDLNTKEITVSVQGKQVPPDLWPPLVAHYPAISGFMDLQGNLRGEWTEPSFIGDITFTNLKFVPTGEQWNGSASLDASSERIALSEIEIEGGYKGELVWVPKQKGSIKAKAEFADADPQLLFDIFKSTVANAGVVKGQLVTEYRNGWPVGSSTFSWSRGQIAAFQFEDFDAALSFTGEKIKLENFQLKQGARVVQGNGDATFRGHGWDFATAVQLQRWGNAAFYIDGETTLSGRLSVPEMKLRSTIQSPLIWINDISFENVSAKLDKTDSLWTLKGGAGSNLQVTGTFNQASNRLDVTLDGKQIQLEEYLAKAYPQADEMPKGLVDIKARMKGPLSSLKSSIGLSSSQIAWRNENLSTKTQLEISGSTISISHAEATLEKGGTLVLSGFVPRTPGSTPQLKGKGTNLNLQSVLHLLGWKIRCEGRFDTEIKMVGPQEAREIVVNLKGHHGKFGPFDGEGAFSGNVVGKNGEWDLSGLRAESGGGYIALLSGSKIFMDRNGTSTMQILADSRNMRAGLLTFFGGLEITGSWKKASNFEESKKPPQVEMDVFARSLWVNHFVLDGNVTHLTLRQGEVEFSPILGSGQQLSGILIHKNYPELMVKNFRLTDGALEKCFLNGLVGPDKWDFDLGLKQVDAGILRNLFDTDVPIEGLLNIKVKGTGNLKDPQLVGDLQLENGHLDVLPIDSAECKMNFKNNAVEITEFQATKKRGYQMTGWVKFPVREDEPSSQTGLEMDLSLEKGDLTFLHDMFPQVNKARGSFTARFRMANKSWGRSVSGYVNAQKITIISAYTPNLEKGQLKIRLDKNRLHIDEAQARLGNGHLVLGGYVDFKNGLPDFYNLSLRTDNNKGINIRVPELSITPGPFLGQFGILKQRLAGASRGEPLVNLILKGSAEEPLLAGTIELENTVFTYPPSPSAGSAPKNTPFRRWAKDFRNRLKLDVSLVAGSRTWYQNELVDANIDGSISFVGTMTDLDVNGKIHTDQGSIVYSGNEFKIKEALLEIQTREPALNTGDDKKVYVYLKATTEKEVFYTDGLSNNNQDTIVMQVDRSLIGEIEPRFYSRYNPNLSSQRALQLALGLPLSESVDSNNLLPDQRARTDEKENTDKLLRVGLVQLLDASLASPLARALARNTGLVDTIRISYDDKDRLSEGEVAVGDETASNSITQNQFLKYAKGTKVKFGRGLSSRLFADYSVRVDEYQNQVDLRHEVELSYQLRRNLYLRGISELENEQSLGRVPDRRAILENQWRFGLPKPKPRPEKPPRES